MADRLRSGMAAAFGATALALSSWASSAEAAGGMTVLTVAGDSVTPNRPERLGGAPGLFSETGVAFEFGHIFDREDLIALGIYEIETRLQRLDVDVVFAGPRLADVLAAADAVGEIVLVQGLGGVAAEISREEILLADPILAIEMDGEPLGVGELGPAMLVFGPVDDPELALSLIERQIWGVYFINVR